MRPVRPWKTSRPRARTPIAIVLVVSSMLSFLAADPAFAGPTREHGTIPAENVVFLSRFDPGGGRTSDVWGYTAPDGREYALVGTYAGVSIVDITSRRRPRQTKFFERPPSRWRDIKTYRHYAYSVNEGSSGDGGGGLGIFDLSDPESPRRVPPYRAFSTAHNLYVDEASGLAFIAGSDQAEGVVILSLADPERPEQVAVWSSPYAHDVFARDGLMYLSAIQDPALWIVDISDLENMSLVTRIANYRDAFTHNAWPTADGSHVMTTDERGGARCRMWSLADPAVQEETGVYSPPGASRAIPHNVLIDGDLAYISYYTAGVRVVDVSDPTRLREIGYFDTVPAHNFGIFDGVWGVFPFYPNSPGLFVASDIGRGLFVFRLQQTPGVGGEPTERVAPPPRAADLFPNPVRSGEPVTLALGPRSAFAGIASGAPGAMARRLDARVFDTAGRLVRALELPAGSPRVTWDGRSRSGELVAPGVYFLSVRAGAAEEVRRVHVIR